MQKSHTPLMDNTTLGELPFTKFLEYLTDVVHSTPKVYTIPEVAKILKSKESTVKNLIHRSKELPACTIGRELRIREEDLKKFLANRVSLCVYDQGVLP